MVSKFSAPLQTSAGMAADLRRLPRTISFTRWLRQALTRRCNVRNCALLAYASGTIAANRSINAQADTDGSAVSQPSIRRYLDLLGNRNNRLDVGDFHAFIATTGGAVSAEMMAELLRKEGAR